MSSLTAHDDVAVVPLDALQDVVNAVRRIGDEDNVLLLGVDDGRNGGASRGQRGLGLAPDPDIGRALDLVAEFVLGLENRAGRRAVASMIEVDVWGQRLS